MPESPASRRPSSPEVDITAKRWRIVRPTHPWCGQSGHLTGEVFRTVLGDMMATFEMDNGMRAGVQHGDIAPEKRNARD